MKTKEIIGIYNVIVDSKLSKMDGEGKIKIVKIIKNLKPIVEDFEDFRKDAEERLKPENFEVMKAKVDQWQLEGDNTTSFSDKEKIEINKFFEEYSNIVNKCLLEELEKEHSLTFTRLSEKEFQDFIGNNESLTAGQIMDLMDYISE